MNKKIITLIIAIVLVSGVAVITTLNAQTKTTFSQANASAIVTVDAHARTITVSYIQPSCPGCSGRSPDILREGDVMATNALDQVENDFTKMKVGDSVSVYFKSNGAASTPYAVKDSTLVPPGCDPITKLCGGSGTITPGGSGGGGTITPGVKTKPVAITIDLSVGVSGDQVSALQLKLQSLGYFPSSLQPTGYFGSVTKKAVIDYQATQGLPTTGFVGPMTRNSLGQ